MSTVEVKVPNIGDFKDVEIIEVMVKPGDTIKVDQSLITVESDKASMEVPSPSAGVVGELSVSVGDAVSQGDLILTLSGENGAGASDDSGEEPAEDEGDDAPAPDEDEGEEPDAGSADPQAAGQEEAEAAP